jgi:hypothetical protein
MMLILRSINVITNDYKMQIIHFIQANGYLIEKWEKWFHFNDFTHDGILSMDDPKAFE